MDSTILTRKKVVEREECALVEGVRKLKTRCRLTRKKHQKTKRKHIEHPTESKMSKGGPKLEGKN